MVTRAYAKAPIIGDRTPDWTEFPAKWVFPVRLRARCRSFTQANGLPFRSPPHVARHYYNTLRGDCLTYYPLRVTILRSFLSFHPVRP